MHSEEKSSADLRADTTPEQTAGDGSAAAEKAAAAPRDRAHRPEASWRIGKAGRLERADAPTREEDDVMALVHATADDRSEKKEPPAEEEPPTGKEPPAEEEAPTGKEPPAEEEAPTGKEPPAEEEAPTGKEPPAEEEAPTGKEPSVVVISTAPRTAPPGDGGSSGGGGTGGGGGDGSSDDGQNPSGRGRRRLRRVLLWTAAGLALALVAGAATAYGYYHSLRSGMVRHDLQGLLDEAERPEKISDAVNILFIGSDGYEEGSTAYTTEFEGERSDSIMLAHISPENRVSVISFPRDSLVDLPQCDPYGTTEGTYGYFGMINAAMYHGGPPCVVRTIESLTDIRIDHFVHLSFMSFRDVVDAIGGVDICIPEPMKDERAKLDLPAGQQTLDGDEALSFVRARYQIGDGGDIGRIDRQQMFLAALADQVMSNDVLTSPTKLNGVLRSVAEHSATDEQLTLDRMLSVAVSLSDVELTEIEFHTVPWYQAPFDPNRILWYEDQAAELFTAVREDRPLPSLSVADDSHGPQEPPGASPSPVEVPTETPEEDVQTLPGGGRDATSNPCQDGLGFGTEED